jgi:alkaline phosphatase D
MIGRSRAPGVFFLSGDRHMAEISRIEHPAVRYPLYEITSSGMTHSYWSLEREPNRHRLGDFHKLLNYGILDFRWRRDAVAVELQIRDRNGDLSLRQVVAFPLQPTSAGKAEGR